jgi:hypothetical protein
VRGFHDDKQSAHFGSTGEDFALVRRLAQPLAAQVQTSVVPSVQSTKPSSPMEKAPPPEPSAAKPGLKNLPKDWITPR